MEMIGYQSPCVYDEINPLVKGGWRTPEAVRPATALLQGAHE
jgi:hypothetical protein